MKATDNQNNPRHHGKRVNRRASENLVEIGASNKRSPVLEIVLKCAEAAIVSIHPSTSGIVNIYSAKGDISKWDVLTRATAGMLIMGLQVDVTWGGK